MIVTLLCGSLAALTASSTALAQGRGNSGLPAGQGSPHADLQRQINSLEQQMESLGMQVDVLSSQIGQGSDRKLAVYDAIEQKVGDIVGVDDNIAWVSLKADNRTFVLQVMPQQLVGQTLWFSDSICMGQAFIAGKTLTNSPVGGANVFSLAAVSTDGTVYVAEPHAVPVRQPVGSVVSISGTCVTNPQFMAVVPASPVRMNLHSLFQRPFSVR